MQKHLEILSFYTRVPLIKIICTLDMMYGSWDMKFNRQNYFVILGHFLPFTPLTAQKIKISKMNKTHEDIIILHKFTKKHDHPLYCSRDVARDRCNCYFILGYTFSFYPPNSPKNENFKALKKKPWIYHHFTQEYQKS